MKKWRQAVKISIEQGGKRFNLSYPEYKYPFHCKSSGIFLKDDLESRPGCQLFDIY